MASDPMNGPELERVVVGQFGCAAGARILDGLPRRYDGHWLFNVAAPRAEFTREEIEAAIEASGVDRGVLAWIEARLTGRRPTQKLRARLGWAEQVEERRPHD